MSHIIEMEMLILSLDALKKAVSRIPGLVFKENQKTYKWYGRSVGDYPIPAGLTKADLGNCEHAIGLEGNSHAYEIGVCKRKDGKPGYTLVLDFWQNGHGLCQVVSEKVKNGQTKEEREGLNCLRLANHYGAEVGAREMRKKGFTATIKEDENRKVVAVCRKS